MSGEEPDFNIDNYGIDELLDIFGISSPLKKEAIMKIAAEFIEKYQELKQTNYVEFFSKAMNKLVSNYNLVEGILGKVDNILDEVIDNKDTLEEKAEELLEEAEDLYEQGSEFIQDAKEKMDDFLNPDVENAGPNVLKNRYFNGQSGPERIGQHVMPNRGQYISVPEDGVSGHAPQLQQRLMLPNTFSQIPFAQGYRNPTLQNAFISWINVDSQYREFKPTGIESAQCNPTQVSHFSSSNKYEQHDTPTDFLFTLQQPITNVMAMTVGSIEVPLAGYYTFSNAYGNTTFELIVGNDSPICIRIPEGNYTATRLIELVNTELMHAYVDKAPNFIEMIIDESNQKTYFAFSPNDPPDYPDIKLRWYNRDRCGCCANCCDINLNLKANEESNTDSRLIVDPSGSFNQCLSKNTGKKINSTFGWTMGFRVEESVFTRVFTNLNLVASEKIKDINTAAQPYFYGTFSQGTWNKLGTKYLILEIDDFNHNRNSGVMGTMTMPANRNKFKLPKYAKELSQIYPSCDVSGANITSLPDDVNEGEKDNRVSDKKFSYENFKRPYRKGTPAFEYGIKGQDTLTAAQKYTMNEIRGTHRRTNLNQYHAPQSSDILFRFPIQRLTENSQDPLIVSNSAGINNGRRYFGPVTIEKLRVRLLDDKGYPVDLHGGEISFSLILERLYQY